MIVLLEKEERERMRKDGSKCGAIDKISKRTVNDDDDCFYYIENNFGRIK